MRNAANKDQVREAERKAKRGREQELDDLRKILSTIEGRRFIWRLMAECKVFGSVWEPSARIHYLAGKQDVGHFVMAEVLQAKQEALLQMMKEADQGEMGNG